MRMVRCYECGKQYDYDDDGFCPKCGSFNQPERPPASGSVRAAERPALSTAGKRRGGSGLQQELGESLKWAERVMDQLLRSASPPRGRRLSDDRRKNR